MNRILLTTGGTGGHIFPALAVADELRRHSNTSILFVGSLYGPEERLTRLAAVPFVGLPVRGLLGRGIRALGAACSMVIGIGKALRIIRSFRPEVVVGFGGYAAFAPMFAARCLGVPSVLHEQNAIAGVSNRILARLAQCVCVSFPETVGFNKTRCVVTGNPVRAAVSMLGQRPWRDGTRRLLVLGGSQGAHALNEYMRKHIGQFRQAGVALRHQTGKADEITVRTAYVEAGYGPESVSAFIDDMAEAYAWADMVLCRAGASTVAELCAAGLPAVLVPFPHAIHDHQTKNAMMLARCGAAVLMPEAEMGTRCLDALLLRLLDASDERKSMRQAMLAVARPDAAARVVDVLTDVAAGRCASCGTPCLQ